MRATQAWFLVVLPSSPPHVAPSSSTTRARGGRNRSHQPTRLQARRLGGHLRQEALEFAGEGKVAAHYRTDKLDNINAIFAQMKAGKINGRVVVSI